MSEMRNKKSRSRSRSRSRTRRGRGSSSRAGRSDESSKLCACGYERAACGACGLGWAQRAIKEQEEKDRPRALLPIKPTKPKDEAPPEPFDQAIWDNVVVSLDPECDPTTWGNQKMHRLQN